VPLMICSECGDQMRLEIECQKNGKIVGTKYYCDACEYCFVASFDYAYGSTFTNLYRKPPEGYKAPNLPWIRKVDISVSQKDDKKALATVQSK